MLHRMLWVGVFSVVLVLPAAGLDMKGLVLYLPFDEGTGKTAKDASGNKNDGAFQGKVDWVQGKYGKAAQVADSAPGDMIIVKNNASLEITKQISLVAWAKIDTMPDGHCSIMTKAETWMLHTSTWRGPGFEWEPLFWAGGGFGAWQTSASVNVAKGEWHHVAGVYDGKQILTYIDGEQKGQVARSGDIVITNADVTIGRDSRGCCSSRKSSQALDDVMIWSRVLSAAEVKEIMRGVSLAVEASGKAATAWGVLKAQP
jgi:beta-galactosidase